MSNVTRLAWLKVQVPVEQADALKERAKRAERSISGELRLALRAYLEADTPKDEAAA